MNQKIINKIKHRSNKSIKLVLKTFNKTFLLTERKGFGVIINSNDKCVGIVTDGDIRLYLSKGGNINDEISKVMNKKFISVEENYSYHQVLRMLDEKINIIPVINKNKQIIDLLTISDFKTSKKIYPRIIRARSPARISFAGGGTDFTSYIQSNQAGVFSACINKFCTASILVRKDKKINIFSRDLNLSYSVNNIQEIKYGDQLDLIKSSIKLMSPNFGFDIETYSDFSYGSGLGGSSAMTAAIIGALNYFRNENHFDPYHISDLAFQAERIELGIDGGWQDQYATVFGGFNWIDFKKSDVIVNPIRLIKEVALELEFNLMLFKIGKYRNSGIIQNELKKNLKIKNKSKIFKDMYNLSVQIKETLLKGNIKKFGDLLDISWNLKKKISNNTTNKKIDNLYNMAKKNGALGGKLLGAGQSGYLLIYASPLYHKKIEDMMRSKGVFREQLNFCETGLEIWSVKR